SCIALRDSLHHRFIHLPRELGLEFDRIHRGWSYWTRPMQTGEDDGRREHGRRSECEPRPRSPESTTPPQYARRLIDTIRHKADTLWNLLIRHAEQGRLRRPQLAQLFPAAVAALDMYVHLPAIVLRQLSKKIIPQI